MSDLQFQPITPDNLQLIVELLHERSGTLPSYARWKYGQRNESGLQGVVVTRRSGEPVGCFGLIVRPFRSQRRTIRCGWFEDWYVSASTRAHGLGTEMLHYVSEACPLVFGHPGPEKARQICFANGYRTLSFQSRRRLICNRYAFEMSRTRHTLKATAKICSGWWKDRETAHAGLSALESFDLNRNEAAQAFEGIQEHHKWMLAQPIRAGVSRNSGSWKRDGLEILFFDDKVPGVGPHRRILFTAGANELHLGLWKQFSRDTRDAGCICVELFTTDAKLDAVWAALGAQREADYPVLIHGGHSVVDTVKLHGWDRQDWTYQADQPSSGADLDRSAALVAGTDKVVSTKKVDTVSVVIPSFRRRKNLLRVLDDLARQTCQPMEAFVVDASPSEEQLTESELGRYPSWLHYEVSKEQGNVSRQRNQVLPKCTGEIVLFLDDDVEFEPGLISDYLDAFRQTEADGISGVVVLPNESLSSTPKHVRTIPIQYPGGPNYQAVDSVLETHVICTASFAVARTALFAVGGFDEQLTGTLDDVDLGIRLKTVGFRILHHNKPKLLHLKAQSTGSRSSELGFEWALTNFFYFQFRHYWGERRYRLLARTLWDYCRPSRHWVEPGFVRRRWCSIKQSYAAANAKTSAGPKLLGIEKTLASTDSETVIAN
jgi:GT2 family glycosyltransferase